MWTQASHGHLENRSEVEKAQDLKNQSYDTKEIPILSEQGHALLEEF